ncbi:GAF domain-containing protein [Nocardioides sp.]|uniref:sensor histidine kinase n=1 Tax=Nocardioides sp. TaxID=35761 RepID=UPI001A1B91A1|nr:GAF domain-containing protein [Nocardioides sp.]MBJ7359315.1 GAF domain-containing protein [Nocardioides sp.]
MSDHEGLADVEFDELLREVLARVHGVLDEQARLRLLLDAVVTMAADLSLDGVLSRIVVIASDLVDAQYAALGVLDMGRERRLRTFIHHGMSDEQVVEIGELPSGHGLLGLIIDQPEPLRLHDLTAHPASYGIPEGHPPMSSFLGVPVRIRDKVFGNLYLTEKAGGIDFTAEDESIVVALAAAAGVAIENARLYEEAEQRQEWLSATAEITGVLADPASQHAALQIIADRARSVAGADLAWVVSGRVPEELVLEVLSGAEISRDALLSVAMEESLAAEVVREQAPVSVTDLGAAPGAVDWSAALGLPPVGPAIVVPLGARGAVEGALTLAWLPERAYAADTLDPALPASFAEQAALALQLGRARADQQRLLLFEDRDRIGRDLHDLVIQRLFAVGLGLESVARSTSDQAVTARLATAVDDLDETIKDIRRTIFALGTLADSTDLQTEVTRLVDRAASTLKFRPTLRVEGPVRTLVPDHVAPDLLAVLGESLSNASRHAEATTVEVLVSAGDEIRVLVSDNGRGMGEGVRESGLGNMRERALKHGGTLSVTSNAGVGTTVDWRVPILG